jgi:signal transduction protein with GAF and PtsI domain
LYHVQGHRRLFKLDELYSKDQDTRGKYRKRRDRLTRAINDLRRDILSLHSQLHVQVNNEADKVIKRVNRFAPMGNGHEIYFDFEKQVATIESHCHNEAYDV